jgi:peptidoglycan/LPS O-acetylase OafA/YrhL
MATYRPDIDGLRAIAVLPVVLFHAGVPGFGGGFVGVDVFFVISGFLITSILLSDLDSGRYSIAGFYDRRVRRIFPALFAMLVVTTLAAICLLAPLQLRAYGRSLIATQLFSSNVLFFLESGYFDATSLEKPLLHTWSLSVEEQFYIVWPLALAAIHRRGRARTLQLTVAVAIVSLLGSIWLVGLEPAAAFYLPLTRAWELMLGSILALSPAKVASRSWREGLGLLGLLGIGLSVVSYGESTPFPGLAAVPPAGGTALLILANRQGDSFVARLLSRPALVSIGLISYSFYLWHWPVLALARYVSFEPLMWPVGALTLLPSAALAYLSWRYVEAPFRKGAWTASRSLAGGGLSLLAMVAVGAVLYLGGGLPWRVSPEVVQAEAAGRIEMPAGGHCDPQQDKPACRLGPQGEPRWWLWGDSHAGSFAPAIDAAGQPARLVSKPACPPLLGVEVVQEEGGRGPQCAAFNEAALAEIARHPETEQVVLAARWTLHAESTRFGDETGGRRFLVAEGAQKLSVSNSRRVLSQGLRRTLERLQQVLPRARVLLVGPVPELGFDAPQCRARALLFGRSPSRCESVLQSEVESRQQVVDGLLEEVAAAFPAVTLFRPASRLCDGQRCAASQDSTLLYVDDDHLSPAGAALLGLSLGWGESR